MSNSCEIISPSRSSNVIRVEGATPHNEGSNDRIEPRPELGRFINELSSRFFVGPVLTNDTTIVPLINRNIDTRYNVRTPETVREFTNDSNFFTDLQQINVLNNKINQISLKGKFEVKKGSTRITRNNNFSSYGISNTVKKIQENINQPELENFFLQEAVFRSPPDLDILDEMYKNNNVTIEYYSSPSKISKNGLIEPLYIRETSTFEFNEKSFKSSLSINDVRRRSFIIKETVPYECKSIEYFEDNVDVFFVQQSTLINNKFIETYNSATKKYNTSPSLGKVHSNKILDMSWISNDNAKITAYKQNYNTMKSEIDYSGYASLNNNDLLSYYSENNISIGNEYPKIFEDKYSTGYTYDRSKVQGLDSIAFSDIME